MKRLIVTADDFGYSKYTNNAIIECFRKGFVTSTSLTVNNKHFNGSIKILKQNKNLDVGIHINLTEFKPLTKSKALIDRNGAFIDKSRWFDGYYKKIDKNEIENEINAQILKAISSRLNITHINGHNHIHIFPNIIDVVVTLAKKYKIKYVRLPNEKIVNETQKQSSELQKRNIMAKFSKSAKDKILKNGLKTTDAYYGILDMNDLDFDRLSMALASIKDGTSELMVHPAYVDKNGDIFHRLKQREKEIKLLTNNKIKQLIKKRGIKLINFSQI